MKGVPVAGRSIMPINSMRTGRLYRVLVVSMLTALLAPCGRGQLNSGGASVALIARLESLSVSFAPANAVSVAQVSHDATPHLTLATSWTLPSNRTTVRVVENGVPLFSHAADDSNRAGSRTDQLDFALSNTRSEKSGTESPRRSVVIVVEAF